MTSADSSLPPIRIECPNCGTSLLTPRHNAAKHYRCPKCDSIFSADDSDKVADSTTATVPAVPGRRPIVPPPPPVSATMKTARLISAQEAKSPLEIAEDGKLPILLLAEAEQQEKRSNREILNSPLVLSGVLCVSLMVSVLLLLADAGPATNTEPQRKLEARQAIQSEYFSDLGSDTPTRQYQVFLREAHRAYARRDYETEHYFYRRVLYLLRAERGPQDSLTGDPDNDRRLRDYIRTIMTTEK